VGSSMVLIWTDPTPGDTLTFSMPGGGTRLELLGACAADINSDGQVSIGDFLAFLGAYSAGDLLRNADFDRDGAVNLLDLMGFLQAYSAGCR
jgi:hypothetical protein